MERAGHPTEIFLAKILWLNIYLLPQLELCQLHCPFSPLFFIEKKKIYKLKIFHPYLGALESLGNFSEFGDQHLMACSLETVLTPSRVFSHC